MALEYNSAVLRKILVERFNDSELLSLCFDSFPDVEAQFAEGMTKTLKVQLLLGHCKRYNQYPHLISAITKHRPDIDLSSVNTGEVTQKGEPSEHIDKSLVDINVRIPYENFTQELKRAYEQLIAAALDVPEAEIKIVRTMRGSTVLTVMLPSSKHQALLELDPFTLETLAIESITLRQDTLREADERRTNLSRADLRKGYLREADQRGLARLWAKLIGYKLS